MNVVRYAYRSLSPLTGLSGIRSNGTGRNVPLSITLPDKCALQYDDDTNYALLHQTGRAPKQ